ATIQPADSNSHPRVQRVRPGVPRRGGRRGNLTDAIDFASGHDELVCRGRRCIFAVTSAVPREGPARIGLLRKTPGTSPKGTAIRTRTCRTECTPARGVAG